METENKGGTWKNGHYNAVCVSVRETGLSMEGTIRATGGRKECRRLSMITVNPRTEGG